MRFSFFDQEKSDHDVLHSLSFNDCLKKTMSQLVAKCRKCRNPVIDTRDTRIISGHEVVLNSANFFRPDEDAACEDTINSLYLMEQTLPDWMISQIDKVEWIKGKLNCSQCQARLGSFDFVSGRKCSCGKFVLPPVHMIKNKLDFTILDKNTHVT
uniref:E3 ubiquitin-protein ligase RNF180 n=1 Tax=Lygus hesperus TaxID=30085 RepID=A0A146LB17_LYGHE